MNQRHAMLVVVPLLALPLAFSVGFGGGREQPRPPRVEARSPGAAIPPRTERAPATAAPLRVVRTERRPERSRAPLVVPREERAESLVSMARERSDGEETRADDYGQELDAERAETMDVATTAKADLDEYGANTE